MTTRAHVNVCGLGGIHCLISLVVVICMYVCCEVGRPLEGRNINMNRQPITIFLTVVKYLCFFSHYGHLYCRDLNFFTCTGDHPQSEGSILSGPVALLEGPIWVSLQLRHIQCCRQWNQSEPSFPLSCEGKAPWHGILFKFPDHPLPNFTNPRAAEPLGII